ncbi:hypothetical protein OMK64_02465 [Cellulomonas fimi]|uniref:hypothetical protein n=1 Tax=Cellulomonas fimi TaxID=1708 RepID=UPI00234D21AB|nr:hypothetical protein [Cellulomonas fimi]MDC7120394.1 hypothetical protein [Cellulomonas fimi]
MKTRTRAVITAAASAAMLAVPAAAQAADFSLYSSSGRSYVWYDDGGNRLVVCDMTSNDGVGAKLAAWPTRQASGVADSRTAYNGCESMWLGDGVETIVRICDWVHVDGGRISQHCNDKIFTS